LTIKFSESVGLSRTGAEPTPAMARDIYRSGDGRSVDLDPIDLALSPLIYPDSVVLLYLIYRYRFVRLARTLAGSVSTAAACVFI
jgi:hypothetical protein